MRTTACLLLLGLAPAAPCADEAPRSRTFLFTYATTVTGLPPGRTARVWLPVPPSNDEQRVRVEGDLPPGGKIHYDPKNDNHCLHLEARPGADGTLSLRMVYRVTR